MFDATVRAVIERVHKLREQVTDHYQVPAEEGLFLAQLVRIGRSKLICEIGTSYGFSTLHLAAAAREHGGHVHTIDVLQKKYDAARKHLGEAGLLDTVTQHLGDARQVIPGINAGTGFDFVFIDATKEQSFGYLEAVLPKLAPRAVLATDNTRTHAKELASFIEHLRRLPHAQSCDVPIGNGVELTVITRP